MFITIILILIKRETVWSNKRLHLGFTCPMFHPHQGLDGTGEKRTKAHFESILNFDLPSSTRTTSFSMMLSKPPNMYSALKQKHTQFSQASLRLWGQSTATAFQSTRTPFSNCFLMWAKNNNTKIYTYVSFTNKLTNKAFSTLQTYSFSNMYTFWTISEMNQHRELTAHVRNHTNNKGHNNRDFNHLPELLPGM